LLSSESEHAVENAAAMFMSMKKHFHGGTRAS
jgi:hypothetical protein